MMMFLDKIRKPNRDTPFPNNLWHTMLVIGVGALLGVLAKLLDIYTSNFGNIFSQMSVWIFLCTVIAVSSSTSVRAAVNVFSFCIGMLTTYYLTAELTSSVYSMLYVYGWAIFSLLSPILGFCVWYAKGNGVFSKIIRVSVILVMFAIAIILFDKIRIADIVFAVLTVIVLREK